MATRIQELACAKTMTVPAKQTNLTTANTPTIAELDAAFGAASNASTTEAFVAVIDENGAATNGMIIFGMGGKWYHIQGTQAS